MSIADLPLRGESLFCLQPTSLFEGGAERSEAERLFPGQAREKRSRGLRFSDHVFIAGVGGGQAGESDGVEGGADLRVKAAVDLGNAGGGLRRGAAGARHLRGTHLLGGAGGVEAVFTALALRDQFAPPTIHYEQPDPECDLDYVPNTGRAQAMTYALSNSLGFGGHNACIALRRWEG